VAGKAAATAAGEERRSSNRQWKLSECEVPRVEVRDVEGRGGWAVAVGAAEAMAEMAVAWATAVATESSEEVAACTRHTP
jgi:hypothetical protein